MSKPKDKHTEGFKALWNIIHTTPTAKDLSLVLQELGGHDDRIASVHHLANVLHWMASKVEAECDSLSEGHERDADRLGDTPTAQDHYMSQVWYAIDAHRMANYCARVEEAHERDDELESKQEELQEEHDGKMSKEQAEQALGDIY